MLMMGNICAGASVAAGAGSAGTYAVEGGVLGVAPEEVHGEEGDARDGVYRARLDDDDDDGEEGLLAREAGDLFGGEPDAGRDEGWEGRVRAGAAEGARGIHVQQTLVASVREKKAVIQPVRADAKTSWPSVRMAHSYTTPTPVTARR